MNYTLIVLLLFTFDLVTSISSSPYTHYKIEDLCSTNPLKIGFDLLTVNKPEIRLDEFHKSGAIVRQSWSARALKKFSSCTFKVVVPEDQRHDLKNPSHKVGIYAFIYRLNLRKTKYSYRNNKQECIDFVQFANTDRSKGTDEMCGRYISDGGYHTEDRNHWYASNDREMRVLLELNKFVPMDETIPLDLVIVFTVYTSNCNSSSTIECAPDQCISKEFQDDTFLNCPPISCQDERKCFTDVLIEQAQRPSGLNGTNIAISAITSLIITMTAVFCIYVCFKYHWCQKNSMTNNSGRRNGGGADNSDLPAGAINNRRGPPGQRIIETEYSSINGERPLATRPTTSADNDSHLAHPTAPILDDDKDKPPSYESLFKNKTGNSNTNVVITPELPNNQ